MAVPNKRIYASGKTQVSMLLDGSVPGAELRSIPAGLPPVVEVTDTLLRIEFLSDRYSYLSDRNIDRVKSCSYAGTGSNACLTPGSMT